MVLPNLEGGVEQAELAFGSWPSSLMRMTAYWSETYNRELKDVFAVQNEIATAVADQMKVKLLGQSARPEARARILRLTTQSSSQTFIFNSRRLIASGSRSRSSEAVRLDPNYALAYAKLSQAWRRYAATCHRRCVEGLRRSTAPPSHKQAISLRLTCPKCE